MNMKKMIITGISVLISYFSMAQNSFLFPNFTNNEAVHITANSCVEQVRLTQNVQSKVGATIHSDTINIQNSFSIEFELYFGDNDGGADGMAFVMVPLGMPISTGNGQGMGFVGTNPSIAVEFDTYQNGFDPFPDHCAVILNGNVDHTANPPLAGPFNFTQNIEDGNWHKIKITWNANTLLLTVLFDGTTIISNSIGLNHIASNNSKIQWGITASTGAHHNLQQVRIPKSKIITPTVDLNACDSLFLDGKWYHSSTLVHDTLVNSSGCDSIIPYRIIIQNCSYCNKQDTIYFCTGDSAFFNNEWHTTTKYFVDTINGAPNTCDSIVSTLLIKKTLPLVSAGSNQTILLGDNVLLNALGANTYLWSTGENTESINVSPTETTTYTLTGTNQYNCSATDEIIVTVQFKKVQLKVPNAFSPNGDNLNDVFGVVNEEDFETIEMHIYNRWGKLIFESTATNIFWNGKYKGIEQPEETYVFYIKAKSKSNAELFNLSGAVQLLR